MVEQGYKETEIGIIPAEWDACAIVDIVDFPTETINTRRINQNFYISTDNMLSNCGGIAQNHQFINYLKVREYRKNDILLSNIRPYLKKIWLADTNAGCSTDVIVIRIKNEFDVLSRHVFYALSRDHFFMRIMENAVGTKMPRGDKDVIKKYLIPLPPLPEQRRIAEVLTDVDSLIESLEKLIAKKKAIKQGAMQELLTGKKRLQGFTGEWVEKKFSDLYDYASEGGTPSTNESVFYSGGTIPFVKIEHLSDKYILSVNSSITEQGLAHSSAWLIPINSIIFSNGATIGEVSINKIPVCTKQGILGVIPSGEISCEFLYYFMSSSTFMCEVDKITTHGTMPVVYLKKLKDVKVIIPSTMDEQTAIANVLSDMDSEIAELEQKLSKYRNVKTGMMQTLLTGKIRLPEEKVLEDAAIAKKEGDMTVTIKKSHNRQFDDAVAIAAIVNAFYSEKYPLGRKKVQKLLYLMRRKQEVDTTEFKKKAAGPYADEIRYKGGEPIATRNGYVSVETSKQGSKFVKGKNISKALDYANKWEMQPSIDWLVSRFHLSKVDALEVLATIDMAICDLIDSGVTPSFETVKHLIASNKEWKEKLNKKFFSDEDIKQAIDECYQLFNYSRG